MIKWHLKSFKDLTADELYDLLDLRNRVFVLEQNCLYRDTDAKDKEAYHLFGKINNNEIVAYARILPREIIYPEFSIGRVCCAKRFRKTGMGKELMIRAIEACRKYDQTGAIRISAQYYLKGFYENLGFIAMGEIYLEDNIEHIEMLLK